MAIVEQQTLPPAGVRAVDGCAPRPTTVDHKKIGIMYVLMAVVFLVIGARGDSDPFVCSSYAQRVDRPDTFNGLFTMHGTTMVFCGHADLSSASATTCAADDRGLRHGLHA